LTCPGRWARIRAPAAPETHLSDTRNSVVRIFRKEVLLLSIFLLIGLVGLPIAVYSVGQVIFGDYGGQGFWQFFLDLSSRVRSGEATALFLILSPYIGWQTLRLIGLGWRLTRRPKAARP
jgi:hypothetical protein